MSDETFQKNSTYLKEKNSILFDFMFEINKINA